MSNRFFARAVFAGLLCLGGMGLACDKSVSGPTAPAPSPVTLSTALTVTSVSPTNGPTSFVSEMRATGTGFQSGATLTVDGVAATAVVRSSTLIVAQLPVHAPGTVDIVVTNPGGQSAKLARGYTFEVLSASLTASPRLVAPGDRLTMSWVGPSGRGCIGGGDWIALYKVGDPDVTGAANGHSDLWYDHLCGGTSGTATLIAPPQSGEYEFRFMIGDTSIARSNSVTVSASAVSLLRD